jgi:pyruvate dehydrogenase E1 component beta subunit
VAETKTYREALREAMVHELDRDENVVLMGEDIGVYGGTHLITDGLYDEYGPRRIMDVPISENGFTGAAVGMAMMGMRPVVEMMTWNFSFLAADQIIQNAAKVRYFSGGQVEVPLVIRGPNGGGVQLSAQHTHSMENLYGHYPGLKVVAPVTPNDVKGLMLTAVRDDNCVIFLEAGALYGTKGEVEEGDNAIPFGKARIAREGSDVTLVAYGRQVNLCLRAAEAQFWWSKMTRRSPRCCAITSRPSAIWCVSPRVARRPRHSLRRSNQTSLSSISYCPTSTVSFFART